MQQDTAEMQGDRELPEVRSFPFGADRTDIYHVEKLIIDKYLGIPYKHRGPGDGWPGLLGILETCICGPGFQIV